MLKSLTGTGVNLLASAPDYVPAASGIAAANIKDLVRKMRTAIVKTEVLNTRQML
jgi:hypothetical protein